jgi:hypothetical protein
MRNTTLSVVVFVLTAVGLAACGDSVNNDFPDGSRSDAHVDGSQHPDATQTDARPDVAPDVAHDVAVDVAHDVAADVAHDTGARCVATCTSNADCQGSCPTAPSGMNCCDITTGVCYVGLMCPAMTPDSGMTNPY